MDKNANNSARVDKIEKASHIVELLQTWNESVDHVNDLMSDACFVLTRAFGHAAYRHFDLLRSKPVMGIRGSLRGQVRNLRWRVAFDRLDEIGRGSELLGEALDVTGLVLDFARGLLHSWHRVRDEMDSVDTWDTKSAKIATQIASVCLRSSIFSYRSSALDAVHRAERVMHAGRWAGGVLGYDVTHPGRLVQFVDFTNTRVDSWADSLIDGDNIYRVVNTYINLPLKRRINLNDHEFPRYGSARDRCMRHMFRGERFRW